MSSKRIEMEASEWLSRLDAGGETPQLLKAAGAWRDADPRHEVAFLRLKASWARLDRLQALRPAAGVKGEQDWQGAPALPPATIEGAARTRRRWYLAAASLVLAAGAVRLSSAVFYRPVYTTGIGGFERVQLNDNSVAELNTDTQLRAEFDNSLRRVELLRGEAYFKVAQDAQRPFVVVVGDTAIRALGTAFNVRRNENGAVEVIVTEGRVAVGQPAVVAVSGPVHTPSVSAPVLSAGESVSVVQGRLQVRALPVAETERELAWQSGMLLFEGDALSEVVAEFNRYNQRQLKIEDPALAPLRIGGYFKATNLDAFVGVLEKDFGVRVVSQRDRIALHSKGDVE